MIQMMRTHAMNHDGSMIPASTTACNGDGGMIPTMTTACEGDGGMIPMMMMMMMMMVCEASRTDELILMRSGANHDEDPIPVATSLEESHDVI
jgi:hypothetical protein